MGAASGKRKVSNGLEARPTGSVGDRFGLHDTAASTRYCLASPGSEYLVYQPKQDEAFTLELAPGSYSYEWFNPAQGESTGPGNLRSAGGSRKFKAPFTGDGVLYLKAH